MKERIEQVVAGLSTRLPVERVAEKVYRALAGELCILNEKYLEDKAGVRYQMVRKAGNWTVKIW